MDHWLRWSIRASLQDAGLVLGAVRMGCGGAVTKTGWIYLASDATGVVIYVGIAGGPSPLARISDHVRAYWWAECASIRLIKLSTYGQAQLLEPSLIADLRPRHNAMHNPDYHYRPSMPKGRASVLRKL